MSVLIWVETFCKDQQKKLAGKDFKYGDEYMPFRQLAHFLHSNTYLTDVQMILIQFTSSKLDQNQLKIKCLIKKY